jgi:hypothetical protein
MRRNKKNHKKWNEVGDEMVKQRRCEKFKKSGELKENKRNYKRKQKMGIEERRK